MSKCKFSITGGAHPHSLAHFFLQHIFADVKSTSMFSAKALIYYFTNTIPEALEL